MLGSFQNPNSLQISVDAQSDMIWDEDVESEAQDSSSLPASIQEYSVCIVSVNNIM